MFPLTEREHNHVEDMIQAIPEIIVAAAIKINGAIVFCERPGRHHDAMVALGHSADHGFVTSRGRYVSRQEGAAIVEAMGQSSVRKYPGYVSSLHSEDMWHKPNKEGPFITEEQKGDFIKHLAEDIAKNMPELK